jgi:hypothetical protein
MNLYNWLAVGAIVEIAILIGSMVVLHKIVTGKL